MYKYF